jgi:hypothetical protein
MDVEGRSERETVGEIIPAKSGIENKISCDKNVTNRNREKM